MTSLPDTPPERRLGLVIDLDTCVGCQACVISCKEWNTSGYPAPLTDQEPYGESPRGAFLNRVHSYEARKAGDGAGEGTGQAVHFPKSCLHCDQAACVTVCPTGASYKRVEDGIVLVDENLCIGCGLCAWACPYGARELDADQGVMKKCTLCIDRIYNENLPEADRRPACVASCPTGARHFGDLADPDSPVSRLVAERDGFGPMPELGYQPTNRYLPPRPRRTDAEVLGAPAALEPAEPSGFLGWLDRVLGD
jgi:Fe-S-cluster-containing dehydrogenase component